LAASAEGVSEVLEPTLDEMETSHDAVEGILALLPDDDRQLLGEYIASGMNGREVERRLNIDHHTFVRRLDKAMKHAAIAAARFYETADVSAPEQYRQVLEGVEVKRTDVAELVLNTYDELRSVRKTADELGLNREKVRRIVSQAA
jgi:transposase-like protein